MNRIFSPPDCFSRHHQSRRQRIRQQKGSIMVLTAVLLVAMIGILALAIDVGYLFSARAQLQNAIVASALAAGAGLRVTMEFAADQPEQKNVAISLARRFIEENQSGLEDKDFEPKQVTIEIDPATNIPRVQVNAAVPTRLIFASLFTGPLGFDSINMGAAATASLLPVDGGTGTIGATGTRPGGCWRPLFLPDTFYNSANTVEMVGIIDGARLPTQPGDYYRSRFAAGARNTFPFVDAFRGAVGPQVTGLRDTPLRAEIGQSSIMGKDVTFSRDLYLIPDFSALPRVRSVATSVRDIAAMGYCGNIRVGQDIPVYPITDQVSRDQVRMGLQDLRRNFDGDAIEPTEEMMFRYVKSAGYPIPNTHGAIIPVLLYDPMLANDLNGIRMMKVTNIGLLYLRNVTVDGDLQGYFVREIIGGGIPIDPANMDKESDSFRQSWLPMAVQLLK